MMSFVHVSKLNPSLVLFFLLLVFCGCVHESKSDEVFFFENVMIREDGLYVLLGSKPMSSFPIEDGGFPETEAEIGQSYALYLSEINVGNLKETPVTYDEFRKNCQRSVHLHFKKLWESVQDKLNDCIGPRYRFAVRKNPFGERRKGGLFINVPNTILVLKRNYQEFEKVFGGPFDPDIILDEIEIEDSLFWSKVFCSDYLKGLLFGYGRRSSCEFEWRMKHGFIIPRLVIEGQEIEPLMKENIKVKDLRLPNMSVYSCTNRKLEKYKRERELIIKELEGKDFITSVKAFLSVGLAENVQ